MQQTCLQVVAPTDTPYPLLSTNWVTHASLISNPHAVYPGLSLPPNQQQHHWATLGVVVYLITFPNLNRPIIDKLSLGGSII